MRVVVNTSPLIALDRIGRLHLLRDLYGIMVRPQSVLDELLVDEDRHPVSQDLRKADWIRTELDPPDIVLRKDLGPGETAIISLALHTNADLVILDDLQARLLAASLDLPLTGTLGILLAAQKAGLLRDLKAALAGPQRAGFHLPPFIIARFQLS